MPPLNMIPLIPAYKKYIEEFRTIFNYHIAKDYNDRDTKDMKLQAKLILEEFNEYVLAKSRADTIDAVGDMLYVVLGGCSACGIYPDEYMGINLPGNTAIHLELHNEVLNVVTALANDKQPLLKPAINKIYWRLNMIAKLLGFDLFLVFEDIHFSNMTKLWEADDLDKVPINYTYEQAKGDQQGNYIVRNDIGKVVKAPTYKPVDLSGY